MSGHSRNFKKIEIIQTFSGHNGMKLEVGIRKKTRLENSQKHVKLNNILLNNQGKFFFFFFLFRAAPVGVPGLGVELELQLPAYITATATLDT